MDAITKLVRGTEQKSDGIEVLAAVSPAQAAILTNDALRFIAGLEREFNARRRVLPADLRDRRVEITGPVDRKMVFNVLNSGASCFMADVEDQFSSAKKCGHMGGKVLVPIQEFVTKLVAARTAADVAGVPTVPVARTDAESAVLLTSDIDERDRSFLAGERAEEAQFEEAAA